MKSVVEIYKRVWAAAMITFLTDANNAVKEHKGRNIGTLDDAVLTEY
jgi:hypothetical protein